MDWGKHHADANREVGRLTNQMKDDRSRGKTVDKTIQDRGEAITKRADAKEASKNERGGKR